MIISVIIVAHDRREFLVEAISSILRQKIDREKYEIVVVKNFKDEKIDSFIDDINATNVFTMEEKLGSKLKIGIEASKGDVLAFLEDDDIFLEGKLTFLNNKFEDREFGFIHNDYLCINAIREKIGLSNSKKMRSPIDLHMMNNINSFLRNAIKAEGFFNLSCISVRKSLISQEILDSLIGIQIAADNFMFYISCDSNMRVLITNEVYTGYRIHDNNASLHLDSDLPKFIEKKIEFLKSNIFGYDQIEKLINNTEIKLFLISRRQMSYLAYNILSRKSPNTLYKVSFREFFSAYYCTRSWELFALFFMNKVSIIFPDPVKHMYSLYERMKFRY